MLPQAHECSLHDLLRQPRVAAGQTHSKAIYTATVCVVYLLKLPLAKSKYMIAEKSHTITEKVFFYAPLYIRQVEKDYPLIKEYFFYIFQAKMLLKKAPNVKKTLGA